MYWGFGGLRIWGFARYLFGFQTYSLLVLDTLRKQITCKHNAIDGVQVMNKLLCLCAPGADLNMGERALYSHS
jgi:hypothetical protein